MAVEIYLASIIPLAAALQNFEIVTPSLLGLNARVPLSLLVAIAYLLGRFLLPRPAPRRPRHLLPRIVRVEAWRIRHRGPLPYACAIAAGTPIRASSAIDMISFRI